MWERRRRARDQRGAAAVEFALVFPLLLLIVFGILDFGWMLMKANLVNNAARDAVRIASLDGTYSDIDAALNQGLSNAGIDLGDVTKQISCTNAGGASCTGTSSSYAANATSGSTVTVTISYTHDWLTPVGSLCDLVGGGSCVGDTIKIERAVSMVRE